MSSPLASNTADPKVKVASSVQPLQSTIWEKWALEALSEVNAVQPVKLTNQTNDAPDPKVAVTKLVQLEASNPVFVPEKLIPAANESEVSAVQPVQIKSEHAVRLESVMVVREVFPSIWIVSAVAKLGAENVSMAVLDCA